MDSLELHRSSLLEVYRTFFAEVLRLKRAIRGSPEEGVPPDLAQTASSVRARLLGALEQGMRGLGEQGGDFGQRRVMELRYVMAAAADEVFINLGWAGRDEFREAHCEHHLFHSHDAGERIFVRINEILERRDPSRAEIAAVYLLLLSLGFRGKYRDIDDRGQIEAYKRALYRFISRRDPSLDDASRRAFPQAYGHTSDERRDVRLARVSPWVFGLVAVLLCYIAAGHALWLRNTSDLRAAIATILSHPGAGKR
ncbi:DotU family type IV/VI secretion system protein [Sorangium sp. So ce1000]|uniref:DotU family type IV/VI secretion system protein n=1 Tax=Sorangium sp. So ce1000 TaxID=3133325 RepID=UPI003F5EB2F9